MSQQQQPQHPASSHVTLQGDLKTLLSDPKLSDLTLKSNDGKEIKVHRVILAARSPVFCGMLCGEFTEASQSAIELDYDGEVLTALVEYMYTDEAPFLNEDIIQATLSENMVQTLASLIDASTYYELQGLCQKAMGFATKMIEKNPDSSVFWLAVCDNSPTLTDSSLEETASQLARKKPQMLLEDAAASMLSSSRIEQFLTCDCINADEILLFKILQAWTGTENNNIDSGPSHRKLKATELMKHVSLKCIDPRELSTTVTSSGLVSADQLSEAYKQQALLAATTQQLSALYKKKRLLTVWKSSADSTLTYSPGQQITELLDCEPMQPGSIHKWSILIEELVEEESVFDIGLVSSVHETNNSLYISQQDGTLSLQSSGEWFANGNSIGASEDLRLTSGCAVHFTLDFTGQGSLLASVDEKNQVTLQYNVLSFFAASFIPAVSFSKEDASRKCAVKFLGFESAAPR